MKHTKSRNGFTLIELIIVMVILGIMAAVAVPRYLDSISNAEKSAEDAVINSIRSGLAQYANNSLYDSGRATWPTDPFDALAEKPAGYSTDPTDANEVFVKMPKEIIDQLNSEGYTINDDEWDGNAVRLVTAWNTDPTDVDTFLNYIKS